MRRLLLSFSLLSCVAGLAGAPAAACMPGLAGARPAPPDAGSVYGRFVTASGSSREPVHLPANAAGVLYEWSRTPGAKAFSIVDAGTGSTLPVRVRRLAALEQLRRLPLLDPVRADLPMLFRIEPAGGFAPGRRYAIRHLAADTTLEVAIDREALDLERSGIRMVAREAARRETLLSVALCSRVTRRALVQETGFSVPAPLARYRARMLSFPLKAPGIAWQAPAGLLRGQESFSEASLLGAQAFGLPDGARHVDAERLPDKAQRTQLAGVFAFLEVEDGWRKSLATSVDIGRTTAPVFDSLAALRQAMRSGSRASLLAQLAATPVREADRAETSSFIALRRAESADDKLQALLQEWTWQRRHGALERTLRRLALHRDDAVRKAAQQAILRVHAQIASAP